MSKIEEITQLLYAIRAEILQLRSEVTELSLQLKKDMYKPEKLS